VFPADGDAFHNVAGIEEDSAGDLFLSEKRGLVFIPANQVSKALKDSLARVQYRIFDVPDGLTGGVVQSTDGRIWVSTSNGVTWIDPARIPKNALPPPTAIRSITANGTRYASPDGLRLPPRTRDLTVDYTSLSLTIPEGAAFRYKLEGSDTQWRDVGRRRQAFYTNLSPGPYRFRVVARNNDGAWNETGASCAFSIAPTFYETIWFKALMVLAGIGLIWLLYRLRLQQITARADLRYGERLEERTRIARELHDTMLQSFQASLAQMQAGRNLLSRQSDRALQAVDDAITMAAGAIAEGRNAVGDLRSTAIRNDLAETLKALGDELAAGGDTTFQLVAEGPPRELHPVIQDEIHRICGEALRNAFRHARAHRIEADVRYSEHLFRLQIRDDGVGITSEILEDGRSNHFGLDGMRERAEKIGAKLEIWSATGTGTEIALNIPATRAYRSSPRVRGRLFTREYK
jgi:signal transduction histidine kinase